MPQQLFVLGVQICLYSQGQHLTVPVFEECLGCCLPWPVRRHTTFDVLHCLQHVQGMEQVRHVCSRFLHALNVPICLCSKGHHVTVHVYASCPGCYLGHSSYVPFFTGCTACSMYRESDRSCRHGCFVYLGAHGLATARKCLHQVTSLCLESVAGLAQLV